MIFQNVQQSVGQSFLRELVQLFSEQDLRVFSSEFGFSDPNNFDFEKIVKVYSRAKFPTHDHFEYAWAIYDCGEERFSILLTPVRIFFYALFLFCSRTANSIGCEDRWLYFAVELIISEKNQELTLLFKNFLEWFYEFVPDQDPGPDIYVLISWILLHFSINSKEQDTLELVFEYLEKETCSDYFDNYDEEDWLSLVDENTDSQYIDRFLNILAGE